jgi:hypothetical protein
MLSISHAVTGAFIAVKVSNPALAIPLIILSHYLEDAVPHWDAGTGLSNGSKTRQHALNHGIVDLILALIMVLAFFPPHLPSTIYDLLQAPAIYGAFIALLPDFLEAPRNFLKYEPVFLKPLNQFHHSFHHSIPSVSGGLAPQILLLTLLWIFR